MQLGKVTLRSIEDCRVWTAADLSPADYEVAIDDETAATYTEARRRLVESGRALETVVADDFRDPIFARLAELILDRIERGPGFSLLRGLPIAGWSDEEASMMYWGIGTALGEPRPQNKDGDRVYLVKNYGLDPGADAVRGSKTSGELIFHTDSASGFAGSHPDLLGLHCLRPAREGGSSILVSGYEVLNRMLEQRPDLVDRLFRDYCWDIKAESEPGEQPWTVHPMIRIDGRVRMRVNDHWIRKGHERSGIPLGEQDEEPLEVFDRIAREPDLSARFDLGEGDVFFADNHSMLHNRTAFTDDPERPRCLVRLWIRRPD